jgi:uncharacterized membrane protein YadS
VIPIWVAQPLASLSGLLTLIAMAGLGLSVDLRELRQAGARISLAAAVAMAALVTGAVLLLQVLRTT